MNPLVIGGSGGSGTRVLTRIAMSAGYFMGANLSESEDALQFVDFHERYINRYNLRDICPFTNEEETLMRQNLDSCVSSLGVPAGSKWGWKWPKSIHLLPFYDAVFPEMRFLHVIRDGRDMALSSNRNQLEKQGTSVLRTLYKDRPEEVRQAALWNAVNLRALQYGREHMPGRYLVVKFEDLCADPIAWTSKIFDFLDGDPSMVVSAAKGVSGPSSIGRHLSCEVQLLSEIEDVCFDGLKTFGYETFVSDRIK